MAADSSSVSLVQARKAELLPAMLREVRGRRRRRRLVRAASTCGVCLVVATLAWWLFPARSVATPADAAPPGRSAFVCEVVGNRPGVLERFGVGQPAIERDWRIDDGELLEWLRHDQRPGGLVRVGGRVLVLAEAVDPLRASE